MVALCRQSLELHETIIIINRKLQLETKNMSIENMPQLYDVLRHKHK